jgi:hypothetical protein
VCDHSSGEKLLRLRSVLTHLGETMYSKILNDSCLSSRTDMDVELSTIVISTVHDVRRHRLSTAIRSRPREWRAAIDETQEIPVHRAK